MKRFLSLIFVLLSVFPAYGKIVGDLEATSGAYINFTTAEQFGVPVGTVAEMTASPNDGAVFHVTDGATVTDCSTGGGSYDVICEYGSSVWSNVTGKSDTTHLHDDRYYTETETDTFFSRYYVENDFQNGTFDIWQRYPGSSVSISAATETFVADRIGSYITSGSSLTVDRKTFTPGQTTVPGNPEFYHESVFVTDSSSTEQNFHFIKIKDVEKYSGKTVVFSLYAKIDVAQDIALWVIQNFGTGGTYPPVTVTVETISVTTSFNKHIVYITFPSISGKTVGTLSYTEFVIWLSAGSDLNAYTNSLGNQSGTLDIAEIEIYESDIELPVRRRSKEEALDMCLPYGRLIARYDNDSVKQGIGISTIITNIGYMVLSFEKMIKVPSLITDTVTDSWIVDGKVIMSGSAFTLNSAGKESVRISFPLTGTNFESATVSTRLSGAYMFLDAEL